MRHLRKISCNNCGFDYCEPPFIDEGSCPVCAEKNWKWHCDKHNLPTDAEKGCVQCSYHFDGNWYFTAKDLAEAFAQHWEKALNSIKDVPVEQWAASGLGDDVLAGQLKKCEKLRESSLDLCLCATIARLNPSTHLLWEGRELSREFFSASGKPGPFADWQLAWQICTTSFLQCMAELPCEIWIKEIKQQVQTRCEFLGWKISQDPNPIIWWWLLANPVTIHKAATLLKSSYVTAMDPTIAELFQKSDLTDLEAIKLASTPVQQLLDRTTAWPELAKLLVPQINQLMSQIKYRPCTRIDLDDFQNQFDRILNQVFKQREQLRSLQVILTDPPQLDGAIELTRSELRQAFKAHDAAQKSIIKIKSLVQRGHIRQAIADSEKVIGEIEPFSDLNLEFLKPAAASHARARRNLVRGSIALILGFLIYFLLKYYYKPTGYQQ